MKIKLGNHAHTCLVQQHAKIVKFLEVILWRFNCFRLGIYTNSVTWDCRVVYTTKWFGLISMPCKYSAYVMVRNLHELFVYISRGNLIVMTVNCKLVVRCAVTGESVVFQIIVDDNYDLSSGQLSLSNDSLGLMNWLFLYEFCVNFVIVFWCLWFVNFCDLICAICVICGLNRDSFMLFWGAPSFSSYLCHIYGFVLFLFVLPQWLMLVIYF